MAKAIKSKKKTVKPKAKTLVKKVDKGIVNIHCSFNNTIINLTDTAGNVLLWSSAGYLSFKGTKKATPFAATKTAKDIIERAKSLGVSEIELKVKGVGPGRESAIRTFAGSGLTITKISDVTPIPHGGVRPKKVRRV